MIQCNDIIPSSPESTLYGDRISPIDTGPPPETNNFINTVKQNETESTSQISDVKHDVLNRVKADS